MSKTSDPAWSDFWARNAQSGGAAEGGGCLPARWHAIEKAQSAAWARFADTLGPKARLIDLATGDARVLRWFQAIRPDLVLTGSDLAPQLPQAPRGVAIHARTAMEDLPFADDSFDAATSQFGFEYSDVAESAREIARILAPKGRLGLIIHRGDGPILEHNLARQAQIDWVLNDIALIQTISARLTEGIQTKNGIPAALKESQDLAAEAAAKGHNDFGEGSAAWEIPEAVRRTLVMGARSGVQSMLGTLKAIADQAGNEVGRIKSLAGACAQADARDELLGALDNAALELIESSELSEPSGRPFADFLQLSLR
jgi:ubiquinone/menaquinone biosynthesis C-methylase UbiE